MSDDEAKPCSTSDVESPTGGLGDPTMMLDGSQETPGSPGDESRRTGVPFRSPLSSPTEAPLSGRSKPELPPGVSRRNFLNDFPKGMGLGPEADIWTTYMKFATEYDKEMLDTYNGGMENLLVFAALFSAIVTAFLMMSLQLLLPDTGRQSVEALTAVSAQLSALDAAGSSMPPPYDPGTFVIPNKALYINALWIFSLVISLSASVLAMLVKQWLRVYDSDWPSTPREHAHYRQFRYDGLCNWQVPGIASSLPLLLQVSVALFLAGFVVYLWDISPGLRWLLLFLFISGGLGYVGLAVAALIWSDCPYKSPLTSALDLVWCYTSRSIALLFSTSLSKEKRYYFGGKIPFLTDHLFDLRFKPNLKLYIPTVLWKPFIIKRARQWLSNNEDSLDESAICWLSDESFDLSTAKGVVTACFSSPKYESFQEKNRSSIRSAALRCLRPGSVEAETIAWESIKDKLTEVAMARTFAEWEEFPKKTVFCTTHFSSHVPDLIHDAGPN
ncbi:hypothetical protein CALCODRAFT_485736 [Calocera cornea HHB12733]|uniref:DUF6535 domain-containing protein n=1 Tax=Calocera cornea HHB12733 TaxID=1353952 RepID=A0A165E6T1_9BASI|nr:hypothetical protein CALCODRAFT_485736 [Calocera cornea HHB12733]